MRFPYREASRVADDNSPASGVHSRLEADGQDARQRTWKQTLHLFLGRVCGIFLCKTFDNLQSGQNRCYDSEASFHHVSRGNLCRRLLDLFRDLSLNWR